MSRPFPHHIKQVTFIALPVEQVFDAVTSADAWNSFFTTGSELDPTPGGKFIWRWKDWGPSFYTIEVPGKVIEIARPNRFVFEWGGTQPTTIDMRLKAAYGGTVITLKESGYLDTPHARDMILECASGWGEALTLLKFWLEHGIVYSPPQKDS
jgi:uncharacterized protein YndB with AHSA1/START domain